MDFETWLEQYEYDGKRFCNPLAPVSSKTGRSDKAAVYYKDINIVKCWRMEKAWTPINFYMAVTGQTFKEAIHSVDIDYEKKVQRVNYKQPKKLRHPAGFQHLMADGGEIHREYVLRRGFDPMDLALKGFGFSNDSEWNNYLLIPFRYKFEICYWQGRAVINKQPKYKNFKMKEIGYGKSDLMYNWDLINEKEVWITEGWACAETIGGAAYLGAKLSSRQLSDLIQAKCEKVVMCPDRGKELDAYLAASVLLKYKAVSVLIPDEIDINARGGVDGLVEESLSPISVLQRIYGMRKNL